jgi:hypothetical protein
VFEHECELERIDGYAFAGCSSLASLVIPGSVITIDSLGFAESDCRIDESESDRSAFDPWDGLVLDSTGRRLILSLGFRLARPSAGFGREICWYYTVHMCTPDENQWDIPSPFACHAGEIPDSVDFLEFECFCGCNTLAQVTFKSTATPKWFGERAFCHCLLLSSFIIPA